MTRFTSFDVLQLAPRCLTLKWALENIPSGYTEFINLYKSEAPDGPWEPVGTGITGREYFHDHDANIYHPYITIYYKATGIVRQNDPPKGVDPIEETIKPSGISHLQFKPDTVALDIIRRQNLLLLKRVGTPGYFLIRRTWGMKCTACYNEKLDKVMTSDCGICFQTKYVGGYYKPILGYCAADNQGKTELRGEEMNFSTSRLNLWTTNSPELKKGDIWVDATGKRWIIEMISSQTTKLRTVLRQLFTADLIPAKDRIYEIAVPSVFTLETNGDNHIWRLDSLGTLSGST